MIEEPQVRADGLCVQCQQREAVGDCFCSTECCRAYYGVARRPDARLSSAVRDLLLDLLDENSWRSTAELADKTGLKRVNTSARLRKLEAKGLIEGQRGPGNSRVYRRVAA